MKKLFKKKILKKDPALKKRLKQKTLRLQQREKKDSVGTTKNLAAAGSKICPAKAKTVSLSVGDRKLHRHESNARTKS